MSAKNYWSPFCLQGPACLLFDKKLNIKGSGDLIKNISIYFLYTREWEFDGQLWRQRVSASPATRLDVMNLQVFSFSPFLLL